MFPFLWVSELSPASATSFSVLTTATLNWLRRSVGRSVKLLLVFASTVVPGLSLLEIHDQDFYSLLDMYVFRNGVSSSTKKGSVFLCRRCVSCTEVSYEHICAVTGPGHYGRCAPFVTALYYVTFIQGPRRFSINAGLYSRLCPNLCIVYFLLLLMGWD
jgi:hypothetical protein